jgi:hypothetical protein
VNALTQLIVARERVVDDGLVKSNVVEEDVGCVLGDDAVHFHLFLLTAAPYATDELALLLRRPQSVLCEKTVLIYRGKGREQDWQGWSKLTKMTMTFAQVMLRPVRPTEEMTSTRCSEEV